MLPPGIASAPKPLIVLFSGILLGEVAFALMQPFQLLPLLLFAIRLGLLLYLTWGTLVGRSSAMFVLALMLLAGIGVKLYVIRESSNPVSAIDWVWTAFLAATVAYMCFAPAARRFYVIQRTRNASTGT